MQILIFFYHRKTVVKQCSVFVEQNVLLSKVLTDEKG